MHDVIIIGGSYAGLAAALQLGRARRDVLILDTGVRRNRFSHSAHGLLGFDGVPPEAIREAGRANVLAYSTVSLRTEKVTSACGRIDDFTVTTEQGTHRGRRLVLATGIVDELPSIPGVRERWGAGVFHCPYCDGYERNRGRLGVLATNALSAHFACLVADFGEPGATRLYLHDGIEPDAEGLAELARHRVTVVRGAIRAVSGEPGQMSIALADGARHEVDSVFVAPRSVIANELAEQLRIELEQGPTGPYYKTDPMKASSVPGVYACGDVAAPAGTVTFAVADGARAGISVHQSLVFAR